MPHACRYRHLLHERSAQYRRVWAFCGSSSAVGQTLLSCFLSEFRKLGWTEGRDFKLEVRWTEGVVERYPSTRRNWSV